MIEEPKVKEINVEKNDKSEVKIEGQAAKKGEEV